MLAPTLNLKVGNPPSVFKLMTSLKVAVTLKVSPALSVLLSLPVEPLNATLLMLGAKVSMLMLGVVPAVPKLPAVSV